MPTVLITFGFFLLAVLLHLLLCRVSPQKNLKVKPFMMLALMNLVILINILITHHLAFVLTAVVIYVLLVPAYLVFYVSTELMSPSKKILQIIAAGPCAYSDIFKALERENFIMLRLEELEHSGCLSRQKDRYCLTVSGQAIANMLGLYQLLLGREVGG